MFPILTIVGGVVTASPVIVARKPDAARLFAKLAPYLGFLGLGMLVLGLSWLLRWLPHVGATLTSVQGIVVLAMIVADLALGFLLGSGLLSSLLARSPAAKERSEALIARLTSVQIPLGLGAAGLGVASFVL